MNYVPSIAVLFDLDFDGHFGISDVLLILILITAMAAAGKVINTMILYGQRKLVAAVLNGIQPELDRIVNQVEPNGGYSLHDEVKRTSVLLSDRIAGLTSLQERIGSLEIGQVGLDAGQIEILARISELKDLSQ